MNEKLKKQFEEKFNWDEIFGKDSEALKEVINFIDQNFIGKEEVRDKIENYKYHAWNTPVNQRKIVQETYSIIKQELLEQLK